MMVYATLSEDGREGGFSILLAWCFRESWVLNARARCAFLLFSFSFRSLAWLGRGREGVDGTLIPLTPFIKVDPDPSNQITRI